MRRDMDRQLQQFFDNEVRMRKEPQIQMNRQRSWRGLVPLFSRLGTVAACLCLLWGLVQFRQDHPLDNVVQPQQIHEPLNRVLDAAAFVVDIALFGDK